MPNAASDLCLELGISIGNFSSASLLYVVLPTFVDLDIWWFALIILLEETIAMGVLFAKITGAVLCTEVIAGV